MDNNGKFVLYESVLRNAQHVEKFYGQDAAYRYLIAVMEYGCYGLLPDQDDPVWAHGFESASASISAASDRYAKAQRDGAKGGRARKSVDIEDILELQEQHLTQKEIAARLNISPRTVQRRLQEHRDAADAQQRQNTTNVLTHQNDKTTTEVLTHSYDTKNLPDKNVVSTRQNTTVVLTHSNDMKCGAEKIDASMRQNTTEELSHQCDNSIVTPMTPHDAKTEQRFMADECDKTQLQNGGLMRQNAKRRQNLTITNTITKTKNLTADENVALERQNTTEVLTQNDVINETVKELLNKKELTEQEIDFLIEKTGKDIYIFENTAVSDLGEWKIIQEK